jgi:septum formation protein
VSALILASGSSARRAMLEAAGVPFEVDPADIDEAALQTPDAAPGRLALDLAEAKALGVSRRRPDHWVLGADQTLDLDGRLVNKAPDMAAARARLLEMRGRPHRLHSAAVLALNGEVVWSGADEARLTMRDFSDAFLDAYLAAEGRAILASVGCYRLEGLGAQLFERVEGDHFTVLGLPLWAVLAELRRVGALPS